MPLAQFQLLAHAQAEEMAFGELEHQAAEPAPLAAMQPLALPMDRAPARFGQAGDQLQQGALPAAAAARHQVGPARFEAQAEAPQDRFGGGGRLVGQVAEFEHGRPGGAPSMVDRRCGGWRHARGDVG